MRKPLRRSCYAAGLAISAIKATLQTSRAMEGRASDPVERNY